MVCIEYISFLDADVGIPQLLFFEIFLTAPNHS
jgi:hypothetical protein